MGLSILDRFRGRSRSAGVRVALALGGACAASAQIVLLRELLVVFHGNELSLGAILGSWLLWGAAGSWLLGSRAGGFRRPVLVLAILFALSSLLLPATVLATAHVRTATGASPGETLGFFAFLPAVLVLLAPLCFVLGSVFAIGARILDELAVRRGGVSRAYLLESAGAGAGGLVVSLLVLPHLEPLALSFALSAALLSVSLLLGLEAPSPGGRAEGPRSRPLRVTASIALVTLMAAFAVGAALPQPDRLRRRIQWRGMELLEARNSLLGNLAAVDMEGEISLYENGLLVVTSGWRMHAEELVHLGMVQHADPRHVLLIGGGLGGSLREILKYPIEHCDYIELDPEFVAIGRRHLPPEDLAPLDDPRVTIHHVDGRHFVKNAPSFADAGYDIVMLDLPGPRSAQLNRFYSSFDVLNDPEALDGLEFFREAARVLRKDGVLVFGVSSSEVSPTPTAPAPSASAPRSERRLVRLSRTSRRSRATRATSYCRPGALL